MVPASVRIPVSSDYVFPHGALFLGVEPVRDFDANEVIDRVKDCACSVVRAGRRGFREMSWPSRAAWPTRPVGGVVSWPCCRIERSASSWQDAHGEANGDAAQ